MSETVELHSLNFDDILPVEVKFTYREKQYVLREATAGIATKYRNLILKSARMKDGQPSGVDGLVDSEIYLISACLSEITDKGEKLVSEPSVRNLPYRVSKRLFEKAVEISDLDSDDTEASLSKEQEQLDRRKKALHERNGKSKDERKNECDATEDGSA